MPDEQIWTISHRGPIIVIEFAPKTKLSADVMDRLQPVLLNIVNTDDPVKVVVDCANILYMSSLAIGTLLTMQVKAERRGSHVVIANTSDGLKDILETVKIAQRFEIVDSYDEAMRRLMD